MFDGVNISMLLYHKMSSPFLQDIKTTTLKLINNVGYQQVLNQMFDPNFYFTHIPALEQFFSDHGIDPKKIFAVMLLGMNPGHRKPIHVDASSTLHGQLAINIPIQGTENSQMCWYSDAVFDFYNQHRLYGTHLPCFVQDNSILPMATLQLDEAYLVRVDIPHDVHHQGSEQRIILSMRLNYKPDVWPDPLYPSLTICDNLIPGQLYKFA